VCTRAKNHYDPQAGTELFAAAEDVAAGGQGDDGAWVAGFQQTHEQMGSRMYFC